MSPSDSKHLKLGRRGERYAAWALRWRGYRLLARNYRTKFGEIDIVARHGGTLVFVEVKTRRSTNFIAAEDSVGPEKQRHIHRTAQQYMRDRQVPDGTDCRIDVVSVTLPDRWWARPRIEVFRDAFEIRPWG